jgi:hypothetical protein
LINLNIPKISDTFIASSGLRGFQSLKDVDTVGRGAIPAQSSVKIDSYFVKTSPYYYPNNPGIAGNFYHITPEVVTINGINRSEFGIHNNPSRKGTAGCIGLLTEVGWTALQKWMSQFQSKGIKEVPLLISYSK